MVKPALAYLDVIAAARQAFDVPIAAYNVSGEYGMIMAAVERGMGPARAGRYGGVDRDQAGWRGYDLDLFRQRGRRVLARLTQLCNSKAKSPSSRGGGRGIGRAIAMGYAAEPSQRHDRPDPQHHAPD